MMRRLFWFTLGAAVGAAVAWRGTQLLSMAKPQSIVREVGRGVESFSTKAGAFLRDFDQARREAEADLRRETGLEL